MTPYKTAVIRKELNYFKTRKHYINENNILENHITDNNMNMNKIMKTENDKYRSRKNYLV